MNLDQKLIIVNGKDKTDSIVSCQMVGSKVNIVFSNTPRVYSYNSSNVRFLSLRQKIEPNTVIFKGSVPKSM